MNITGRIQPKPYDISPHFTGSTTEEARAVSLILDKEATPEAIREFTRHRNKLGYYTYWYTLGVCWVNYTGHSDLNLWKRLFSANHPHRADCLMKPSELAVLWRLPDTFTVFRAHRPGETDWIAYTLSMDVVQRFARERGVDEVKVYEVDKADVLALFLRRSEFEVLVLDKSKPRHVATIRTQSPTQHAPVAVEVVDTKTGASRIAVEQTWFDWTQGNWACDCNRRRLFEPGCELEELCIGTKRYLVTNCLAARPLGEWDDPNSGYDSRLVTRWLERCRRAPAIIHSVAHVVVETTT